MNRILHSLLFVGLGLLAGCPAAKSACDGVTCTTGSCDPNTGMCSTQMTDKCTGVSCEEGVTCDTADGACKGPAAPTVAATTIDRMGRPGVNTALTNPFDLYKPQGAASPQMGDATKDAYNADGAGATATPTPWASWIPAISMHLAILDGLDRSCGNQLLAGGMANATRYTTLATILAGDALQVDLSKTTCAQYLGVEAAAVGVTAAANDCGGRKLDYDVIDRTYSVLAAGALSGVDDGIAQSTAPLSAFPYMAAPK